VICLRNKIITLKFIQTSTLYFTVFLFAGQDDDVVVQFGDGMMYASGASDGIAELLIGQELIFDRPALTLM
jgi:hypothetical protein